MKTQATARPWIVREIKGSIAADIVAASGRQIAIMTEHHGDEPMTPMSQFVRSEQDKADAELIVRAVNCHDELVEFLEDAMNYFIKDPESQMFKGDIKRLIKRAKGEN